MAWMRYTMVVALRDAGRGTATVAAAGVPPQQAPPLQEELESWGFMVALSICHH
jgi:hypothetical protein